MATKGTMFFTCTSGTRAFGWTESFLINNASLPDALTLLTQLALRRANLLGAGCMLPWLRVSKTDIFRDSQVGPGPTPTFMVVGTQLQLYNPIQGPVAMPLYDSSVWTNTPAAERNEVRCDFPYSGLLLRLESNPPGGAFTTRSSYILRGAPDIVQYTLRDSPSGTINAASNAWLALLTNYLQMLLAGNFGIMALNPANTGKAITAFTSAANAITLTIPTSGFAVGDEIRISQNVLIQIGTGATTKILNGVWHVKTVNGDLITLVEPFPDLTGWIIKTPGKATKRARTEAWLNKEVDRRWAERKTGIPFDRPIGRRRARRSA